MHDPADAQRWRAAHHEAAHAVLVVAERFILGHAFLTRGTTADGSIGGCTNWWAQNAAAASPIARAHVLYAGQYAERHLATLDSSVRVPAHDENWNNDDDVAAAVLGPVVPVTPNADSIARRETAHLVREYWRAITNVARGLYEAHHDPGRVPQQCLNAAYLPESRVIEAGEVRRYFGEDRIAAGAFAASAGRSFSPGGEVRDWLTAQKQVGVSYPVCVDDWIADDNVGNQTHVARFRFGSSAEAQQAQAALAPLAVMGFALQLAGDDLTVTLSQPGLAGTLIQYVQRFGGEYVRRRCALPLR